MNNKARNALIELVRRFGPEVATDLPRLRGLLRDYCLDAPAEIRLLLNAAEDGIPSMLQGTTRSRDLPSAARITASIKHLKGKTHLAELPARWAVESWAIALEVINESQLTVMPQSLISLDVESCEPDDPFAETSPEDQLRQAIRGILRDGMVTDAERQAVRTLQLTLGISSMVASRMFAEEKSSLSAVAKPKSVKVDLGKGMSLELTPIPAGRFMMGSPEDEEGRENEESLHQVTLSKPFWMATTQVTQAQWQVLMGNNPSGFKENDLPVEMVSWDDAMCFCEKLTVRDVSHIPAGYQYRLPTEAEWEYACRAGSARPYAGNCLDVLGWYYGNAGDNHMPDETLSGESLVKNKNRTHRVGQKQPNAWGLYDMHGNVWEWCLDWYGNYPVDPVTDPVGPKAGDQRVTRGGCFFIPSLACRSASRYGSKPDCRYSSLGFRIILAPVIQVVRQQRQEDEASCNVVEADAETEEVKSCRLAAERGDAGAQFKLGVSYEYGTGVVKDVTTAAKWYRKAAEQGMAFAQFNLGIFYANGIGVAKNEIEAVSWYHKAAQGGDATAQSELGVCYANGIGVAQDYAEAVRWWSKGAEGGRVLAQFNLGFCYATGTGITKNEAIAVKWWKKAAEQGSVEAQYNLGFCYVRGAGVGQDYSKAMSWWSKAADQGYIPAMEVLQKLRK